MKLTPTLSSPSPNISLVNTVENYMKWVTSVAIGPNNRTIVSGSSDETIGIEPETGDIILLFNPRTQVWSEHFRWSEDGISIIGKTPTGRATVTVLQLNDDPDALIVRSYWVMAGWHPPED